MLTGTEQTSDETPHIGFIGVSDTERLQAVIVAGVEAVNRRFLSDCM